MDEVEFNRRLKGLLQENAMELIEDE